MSASSLEKQIIALGEKNNIEQLKKLLEKTSTKALTTALKAKLGRNDCITFWNFLLQGFAAASGYESKEKRFACIKCFLDGLLKIELTHKQMYDLITRLCLDLPTFPNEQLVEILEHCMDALRVGDPKCVGWKDLLPETLKVLCQLKQLSVNGITMSGTDYRDTTLHNLCTMRWPTEVVTPIADMFKELNLDATETMTVLKKFSSCLQSLAPTELPALAYQLFSMCSTAAQIIVPIIALEKYFYRFYYKKLFADMHSNTTDFDSIEAFSDKELREAEETILHHLNYCTQYKLTESQMCLVLRNFLYTPDAVLTPFMLSAILSMTVANREPDSRLSSSVLLPFLRQVIRNNEDERTLADYSVWCRDSLQRKQVDLELIFTVLIDQNKEGKDVITPGLVNLAFVLLKTKQNKTLNELAIGFLTKFIRKRFVFGQGVVKKLAEWMVVEQDQYQYSDCLTLLSVADTFTVSECVKTINYVMDFFLWIPGEQAMRMMSFILPILKISATVRDAFIEILRKAMNSNDVKTCRMGIYGFCMILKQLNNSNSQRSQLGASGTCTQHSISGFSLMSQATLGSRNNPQRNFDMLTLEIIGLLRSCFNKTLEIKMTLYENLQRAVELNPKLVPHVLQFIDWHFRSYFNVPAEDEETSSEDTSFSIKFDSIVRSHIDNDNELEVNDNLGRLIQFVSYCLVIFDKNEGDYDTREMKRLLHLCIEKVATKELKFEDLSISLTHRKREIVAQQLNFIEGLMTFSILTSTQFNENVKNLLPLFKEHVKLTEALKSASGNTKKGGSKKSTKSPNETKGDSTTNITINGVGVKRINTNVENIWDLQVIEKFLRLLHENIVPFAAVPNTNALRSNCELVRYVMQIACSKVEAIRLEPKYKQLAHSQRTLKYLTDITKVVYERCIRQLSMLWKNFDLKTAALAAQCFQQCLVTANEVYKKKFADNFVRGFDFHVINNCKEASIVLHELLDEFMQEDAASETDEAMLSDPDGCKIPQALLHCLEVFYDNTSYSNRLTIESYTWLLKFCKENEVHGKELSLVHKLLFTQRQKTHSGAFFNTIAQHLGIVLGRVSDDEGTQQSTPELPFHLKSITLGSAESCLNHLYATLRKQIEDVDYFISKANNSCYKYRIVPDDDREMCLASLRSLERSICMQLIHISNTLLNLTNVCIPLGASMDNLLRLIMQHYVCLKNLAKHFLQRCSSLKLSMKGTKFDSLLHVVGKPLPTNIYALITYIEANIFEDHSKQKKTNPQAEKAKVLRETKLIPKIILCVENFNKHVILLSKKSSDRLADFLHFGTVRDFRIKTSELKKAIERTLSHSSQIEVDVSDVNDEQTEEDTLLDRMEAESCGIGKNTGDASSNRSSRSTTPSVSGARVGVEIDDLDDDDDEPTPDDVLENESNEETNTQLLKNLAKINKKAKKRSLKEDDDPDVNSAPPIPKKRRGRSTRK